MRHVFEAECDFCARCQWLLGREDPETGTVFADWVTRVCLAFFGCFFGIPGLSFECELHAFERAVRRDCDAAHRLVGGITQAVTTLDRNTVGSGIKVEIKIDLPELRLRHILPCRCVAHVVITLRFEFRSTIRSAAHHECQRDSHGDGWPTEDKHPHDALPRARKLQARGDALRVRRAAAPPFKRDV